MDGVRYEQDGDDTVFLSRTRNGISHRVNGHCSCEAGEKGDPCWHRAASMIIKLINDIERITLITPPMAPPECPRCQGYMFDHKEYFVCSACQYTVNASKKERVSRDQAMKDMQELYER
ncbi:MAG: hypothetical protein GFH27_549413n16 [Chloroflexi bacterium AL-W]|nr:hypothetical protein [Chloroflexi bacterium AL-N1]NOK71414.1 hypothetical protein [Chloroflexi bacterium AL-N10]NOK78817.1 hypothetical protein [Chloroflexi bacterium AL-N5]NOK86235.1 hypothetical protein [Chloroflexi bacterium AL-W]NOK93139.1 hypothetical protein [Chloroflexi bacterium AL-N15]